MNMVLSDLLFLFLFFLNFRTEEAVRVKGETVFKIAFKKSIYLPLTFIDIRHHHCYNYKFMCVCLFVWLSKIFQRQALFSNVNFIHLCGTDIRGYALKTSSTNTEGRGPSRPVRHSWSRDRTVTCDDCDVATPLHAVAHSDQEKQKTNKQPSVCTHSLSETHNGRKYTMRWEVAAWKHFRD